MSKVLEKNKDIIHIVCEVVAFSILTYIFTSKFKKLSNQIVFLNNRIIEQDKKFEEYDMIIRNLSQNKRSNNVELKPTFKSKGVEIMQENPEQRKEQTINKTVPQTTQSQPIQRQNKKPIQQQVKPVMRIPQPIPHPVVKHNTDNTVLYNDSSETTSELDAQLENELKELDTEISAKYSLLQTENEQIQKELQTCNTGGSQTCSQTCSRIQSPILIPEFIRLHENVTFDLSKIEENTDQYNYSISRTTSPNHSPEDVQSRSEHDREHENEREHEDEQEHIEEISTSDMEEYKSPSSENDILETISMIFQKSN